MVMNKSVSFVLSLSKMAKMLCNSLAHRHISFIITALKSGLLKHETRSRVVQSADKLSELNINYTKFAINFRIIKKLNGRRFRQYLGGCR